jgi:hypothetical protein
MSLLAPSWLGGQTHGLRDQLNSTKCCTHCASKPLAELTPQTPGNPIRVSESDYGDVMKAHSTGEWLEAIKTKSYGSVPGLSDHPHAELQSASSSAHSALMATSAITAH